MGKKSKGKDKAAKSDLPTLHKGEGSFTFPNGDVYEGEFCAHRSGLLWREGYGTYTTNDGQIYVGHWVDDKLVEKQELIIKYMNGSQFCGCLVKDKYNGSGFYTLENDMRICCEFVNNQPSGDILLMDCTDHLWLGKAEKDSAILLPENVFYTALCDDKGVGDVLKKPTFEYIKLPKKLGRDKPALTEEEIFAKSKKTLNDVDFAESKWYQNYLRFKITKEKIETKIETNGESSLLRDEMKWWKNYQRYKDKRARKRKQIPHEKPLDTTLLDTYYSERYKNRCPPVRTVHPSIDWDPYYQLQPEDKTEISSVDQFDSDVSVNEMKKILDIHQSGTFYDVAVDQADMEVKANEEKQSLSTVNFKQQKKANV